MLCALVGLPARAAETDANAQNDLKQMSLEQLSQIEVTTPSKEPEKAFRTPSAIYVITGEDIRRSGVTRYPKPFAWLPALRSRASIATSGLLAFAVLVAASSRNVLVLD